MSAGSSAHPNAVKALRAVADRWEVPYVYSVRGGERVKGGETTTLTTLWSKPSREHPVPEAVINVHWVLRQRKGTSAKSAAFDVERYKVENERHWCGPRDGAPTPSFLARILARKAAMRSIMGVTLDKDDTRLEPPRYRGGPGRAMLGGGGSSSSEEDESSSGEDEEETKNELDAEEILDVEGYLIEQFKAADTSGDGVLDAAEVREDSNPQPRRARQNTSYGCCLPCCSLWASCGQCGTAVAGHAAAMPCLLCPFSSTRFALTILLLAHASPPPWADPVHHAAPHRTPRHHAPGCGVAAFRG